MARKRKRLKSQTTVKDYSNIVLSHNHHKGITMAFPEYKNVPVMKGNDTAFTCLGNWYDTSDKESIESMFTILLGCSKTDRKTGYQEYLDAAYPTVI